MKTQDDYSLKRSDLVKIPVLWCVTHDTLRMVNQTYSILGYCARGTILQQKHLCVMKSLFTLGEEN